MTATAGAPAAPAHAGRAATRAASVVPVSARSALVLALGSAAGLAMFCWPLLVAAGPGAAHAGDAPFAFLLCLPLLVAVVLSQVADGGIDVRALAILGVLSGVGAVLRPLGAGTGGIELVFFLLVLAGRVYGPGFGFVLGATTLFSSALLTAGVGPWLPFQMLAAAWVGLGAGLLPRARGRVELALLAGYGVVSAYGYGLLLDLWGWPFTVGTGTSLSYLPGGPLAENLRRFLLSTVATSTIGWDTGRALTNLAAILLVGPAVLAVLRRAARRAAFTEAVTFQLAAADAAAGAAVAAPEPSPGGAYTADRRSAGEQ